MAVKEIFSRYRKNQVRAKESKNPMAYRYYDAEKSDPWQPMKEWLKFAMAWWHTLSVLKAVTSSAALQRNSPGTKVLTL